MRIIPVFEPLPASLFRRAKTGGQDISLYQKIETIFEGHGNFISVTMYAPGPGAMHFQPLPLLVFLASLRVVVSQFKCDYRMYGRPKLEDCASTFLAMPDSRVTASTPKLETFRRFVEPQLLEPPFTTVENDLGAAMEQIPKFWRCSKPIFWILIGWLTQACLHRILSFCSHGYCSCGRQSDRCRASLDLGVRRATSAEGVKELYRI